MKIGLAITLTLMLLLTACDYIVVHSDGNGKGIADYSYALSQADSLARGWNSAAYPMETIAIWTDRDGRLGDSADNPSWMFHYYVEGATEGYFANLLLTGDVITGYLTGDAPPAVKGSYDDTSVSQWMQTALTAFQSGVDEDLDSYDFCWRLFNFQGRDITLVYFFTAADYQGLSDYYDQDSTAWVQLNAETNRIEDVSW
ncbi:hypothetical protein K8R78_01380 [bacterium]|nr:hypothetical protein [bacterium]